MDPKLLKQIKKKLEQEKKRVEKELESFAQKSAQGDYKSKFPSFGDDTDENACEVTVFGERLSMEKTLEKELRDIEKVLGQINDGSYDGKCKYCKQPIDEARLLARPTSSSCVACKKGFKNEK